MRGLGRVAAIGIAVILGLCAGGCGTGAGYSELHEFVFGGQIELFVRYQGPSHRRVFQEMLDELDALESLVDINNPDSAVSRFNAGDAGAVLTLDPPLDSVVAGVFDVCEKTGGAFDPSLAPLNRLFSTDAKGLAAASAGNTPEHLPTEAEIAAALAVSGLSDTHVERVTEEGRQTLCKRTAGCTLDLNGYIKGYAADRLVGMATDAGADSVLINLGGEVATAGNYRYDGKATDWTIGIVSPDPSADYLCAFSRPGGTAVATSGNYERFYTYRYPDGQTVELCHLTHGQTGLPAGVRLTDGRYENDPGRVVSATVLSGSAAFSDALATAVCVLGADEGAALVKRLSAEAVIFTADSRMVTVGDFSFSDRYTGYRDYARTAL